MTKFAVITSSLSTKNRIMTMDTLLATASFFKETTAKLFTKFKHRKSTLNTSEILDLSNNSGIIKPCELSPKKTNFGGAKTIEEFNLADCFDKSEIIAIKAKKTRVSRSYCNNINKEKWQYDQERESKENCRSKNNLQYERQINQLRGK